MQDGDPRNKDDRWELASWAANEGIWDWDIRTNKVYRSDFWFRLFGYAPDEIAATSWAWDSLLHPDDAARVLAERRAHIEGQSSQYYSEHRVLCKDGQYRWFLSRGKVIRDENGDPVRMLGFYTNIEERIRDRSRLQRQNEGLKSLYDISIRAIGDGSHDATMTAILDRIREFMTADRAYLLIYDPVDNLMRMHSTSGAVGPTVQEIRRGEYMVGWIWETGEYQCVSDYSRWTEKPSAPDAGTIQTACGVPLKLGADILGVIAIAFNSPRTVLPEEVALLRQFAAITALLVRNRQMSFDLLEESYQRVTLESSLCQNERIDFLNELVEGKPLTNRRIAVRAAKVGLSLQSGYIAMVGVGEGETNGDAERIALQDPLLQEALDLTVWRRGGQLYLLAPQPVPENDRLVLSRRAEELRQLLRERIGIPISRLGVGLHCPALKDISAGFYQATEALEFGQRLHPEQTVHHYLEIGMLRLLARNGDRSQIDLFVRHTLGKLLDYDREKNAHLAETLTAILRGGSLHSVAAAMYVHPKTLLFRKHRIEEILGEPLDNPRVRMNLELAFQLNELRGKK